MRAGPSAPSRAPLSWTASATAAPRTRAACALSTAHALARTRTRSCAAVHWHRVDSCSYMLTHARCCTDAEIWMYSSSRRPLAYLAADGSLLPAASSVGAGASPILYNDLACCKTHTRPPTPPCTPSVQPCVRVSRVRHARLTAHLELAGRQCGAAVAKVAVPSAADGLERVERVVVHKQRGRRLTGRVAVRSDRGRLGRTCGRLLAGAHELRDVRLQQVRNVLALPAVPNHIRARQRVRRRLYSIRAGKDGAVPGSSRR